MENQTLVTTPYGKFWTRNNTVDAYVVGENTEVRQYLDACTFGPQDVWLDAGGHIGTFSIPASSRVGRIITLEPSHDNFVLLQQNLLLNHIENVTALESALVGTNEKTRAFFVSTGKNTAGNSLYHKGKNWQAVEVLCTNINTALEWGVTKLKLDIEGGEYEVLNAIRQWDQLEEVIFEWHSAVLQDWNHEHYLKIITLLMEHFSTVVAPPVRQARYSIVHCIR